MNCDIFAIIASTRNTTTHENCICRKRWQRQKHRVWEAPGEATSDLALANCATLLNLLQEMKRQGIFDHQEMSKVVSLSAVAAIRPLAKLSLDSIQKAANHSLMRTPALELTRERIFITEIMAGSTDGGYYDNDATMGSILT